MRWHPCLHLYCEPREEKWDLIPNAKCTLFAEESILPVWFGRPKPAEQGGQDYEVHKQGPHRRAGNGGRGKEVVWDQQRQQGAGRIG